MEEAILEAILVVIDNFGLHIIQMEEKGKERRGECIKAPVYSAIFPWRALAFFVGIITDISLNFAFLTRSSLREWLSANPASLLVPSLTTMPLYIFYQHVLIP